MKQGYTLTLVGRDKPGIVAAVTQELFLKNCNLGETSMARLGGNFSVMMTLQTETPEEELVSALLSVTKTWGLDFHLNPAEPNSSAAIEPNVRVNVYGADQAGIVATVTGALAQTGFNIVNLESDVGGDSQTPVYILTIEGVAPNGPDPVEQALKAHPKVKDMEFRVEEIDTLIG